MFQSVLVFLQHGIGIPGASTQQQTLQKQIGEFPQIGKQAIL
jgi:hypothetical protein